MGAIRIMTNAADGMRIPCFAPRVPHLRALAGSGGRAIAAQRNQGIRPQLAFQPDPLSVAFAKFAMVSTNAEMSSRVTVWMSRSS